MEEECFFSGYCRQLDAARTVTACFENSRLTEADCCFGSCLYETNCPIGKEIAAKLAETK